MTPDLLEVSFLKPSHTAVCLVDHSLVEVTHKGLSKLPIDSRKFVQTLFVPALAEPLLLIAGMTVVFTSNSCSIYNSPNFSSSGKMVGRGYRWANLYYLPFEPVSSTSSSFSPSLHPSVETSMLGYHWHFSHIGLKPLKMKGGFCNIQM
jgi:hypothetical protein